MKLAYKDNTLDLGATGNTAAMKVDWADLFSVQGTWTGTAPTGNFTVQASNDAFIPDNVGNSLFENPNATWQDITGSSYAAGGAAGSNTWNVAAAGYAAIRVRYVRTSGTGTATLLFTAKGRI